MRWLSVANPPCVADNFGGEIVALNLDTGYYYSFPNLAGAVWRDLIAGHSTAAVVKDLTAVDEDLGRSAAKFIDSLVDFGLMQEVPEPTTPPAPPEYRGMLDAGARELVFRPYDDMKDLVMTDPIHDVDEETGWPVRVADRT
jgi:hypothetical protein